MARAGGYGLRIDEALIPVQPVVRRTAELFKFDPFSSISEGTLIAAVDAGEALELKAALAARGVLSAVCGEVVPAAEGLTVMRGGKRTALEHPKTDPYWAIAAELAR
jgi:hydrogenase maturation factor